MMAVTLRQRAESLRAYYRARAALQPGDKVCVGRCGGGRATFRLTGWDGYWMVGKGGGSDYAPSAIVSVNGRPVSFLDPLWEPYDANTGLPPGRHGTAAQAIKWATEADHDEIDDVATFLRVWAEGGAWEEWPEFYRWLTPFPKPGIAETFAPARRNIMVLFEGIQLPIMGYQAHD